MKRTIFSLASLLMLCGAATAQTDFGGMQVSSEGMNYSKVIKDVNYAGDDKKYHNMDIYLPHTTSPDQKVPAVIHIYGSAWFGNDGKGFADLGTIGKELLDNGYAFITPNHRASTDAKWPAQCHDIKAAIRYLRAHADEYGIDPNFIATSGFSSGGHLSALMGATSSVSEAKVGDYHIDFEGDLGDYTNVPSTVIGSVSWSGPIDLQAMDCGGRPNGVKGSPEEVLVGKPFSEETMTEYLSISPNIYVDSTTPPLLGFHGTADPIVPYCQALSWKEKYDERGAKSELITVEGGFHGGNTYTPENLAKMIDFLNGLRKNNKR